MTRRNVTLNVTIYSRILFYKCGILATPSLDSILILLDGIIRRATPTPNFTDTSSAKYCY